MATNDSETLSSVLTSLVGELDKNVAGLANNFADLNQNASSTVVSLGKALSPSVATAASNQTSNSSSASAVLNSINPLSPRGGSSFLSSLVLGPIFRGLFSLFSGDDDRPEPVLNPFVAPQRAFTQIDSNLGPGERGAPLRTDSLGNTRGTPTTPAPIQISIQALDARSILDRSDEIASAVRQAMLTNHSINESLTEL